MEKAEGRLHIWANKRMTQIGLRGLQHKQWAALQESNSGLGGITVFTVNGKQTMPFIPENYILPYVSACCEHKPEE